MCAEVHIVFYGQQSEETNAAACAVHWIRRKIFKLRFVEQLAAMALSSRG